MGDIVQRGYVEQGGCQEPYPTGYVYLTIYEFCRFVFDPGGNLFRFEVESFQEGGDDTRSITLPNSSKRVKNEMPFKFKIRRLLMKIGYKIGLEVKMQHKESSLEDYAREETGGNRPCMKAGYRPPALAT